MFHVSKMNLFEKQEELLTRRKYWISPGDLISFLMYTNLSTENRCESTVPDKQ